MIDVRANYMKWPILKYLLVNKMKFTFYNQWNSKPKIVEIINLTFGYNDRSVAISVSLIGLEFIIRLTKDFPKWDIY